jgi:hypothetical protein
MSVHFPDMAQQAFSFLEGAGFRLTKSEPGQVQYESDKSFVVASWDPRSGELEAFVGLLPRTGRAQDEYSLTDVMGVADVPASDCKPAQVADEGRLAPFVDKLATDLRSHGQPALVGDRMYFRRLETFRGAKAERYMREMKLRQVRSEAEKAWQDRKYDRVANLYASVESDLTESESRKLDYARQHRTG